MIRQGLAACLVFVLGACATVPDATVPSPPVVTIGFLRAVASTSAEGQRIFLSELAGAGFVPGANLELLAEDKEIVYPDPAEAGEVAARWAAEGADLIFALSSSGAEAAAAAAPDVPVLFISNDPAAIGLVGNESRPEGNLTGVTFRAPADRTLFTAQRAIGRLRTIGLVYPPQDPAAVPHAEAVTRAARDLGLRMRVAEFTDENDAADAVDELAAAGVDAVFISNSPTAIRFLAAIQGAADEHGLPTIANTAVASGAVIIVSPDSDELNRQLGRQAARLLSGSSVSDVPVEDPNDFQLIVNLGVAEQLSVELNESVLREANRVIP